MAFDAGFIAALTEELTRRIVHARIDKIHQPEKDEIDLYLRTKGENLCLSLSAAPGCPRINISTMQKENPPVPPLFCTLLRRHLTGGIIENVHQMGFERAVVLEIASKDDMGYPIQRKLICEMMGKYANLIFLNGENKILGVLRPIDFSQSEKRQLLVGLLYEAPPLQEGKINPLKETREGFYQKAEMAENRPADQFIVSNYYGISPLVAREISFLATKETDAPIKGQKEQIYEAFEGVISDIRNNEFHACVLKMEQKNLEYSFFPISQYGTQGENVFYDSPSALLDDFLFEKERERRVHQRGQDLFKVLLNAENRLHKKRELQKKELFDYQQKDQYKTYGDLITSNLYLLKKGEEEAELVNYFSENMEKVKVHLDKRLSPSANAQRYYKKYAKAKNGEVEIQKQIELSEKELAYLLTVEDALKRALLPTDIEEIRRELLESGYLGKSKTILSKKNVPYKMKEYKTANGFKVLCGRNNLQNDRLTFKTAGKNDWWFHVHNAPGSHVVLFTEMVEDPPAEDFNDALQIAAVNSNFDEGQQVTVDYTKIRYVKKPPASRPGYVIYHTNYSAVVTPDKEHVKALEK